MSASYAIPVRRASALPAASFGFHLAMDTLAVRLTVPPAGPVGDFHPQVGAPCRAHQQKRVEDFPSTLFYIEAGLSYFLEPASRSFFTRSCLSFLTAPGLTGFPNFLSSALAMSSLDISYDLATSLSLGVSFASPASSIMS